MIQHQEMNNKTQFMIQMSPKIMDLVLDQTFKICHLTVLIWQGTLRDSLIFKQHVPKFMFQEILLS